MAGDVGSFQIAPARLRDLRAVARIQRLAFRPGLAYGMSALLVLWSAPHSTFLVARDDSGEAVIGCVIADRHQGNARIMNIATHPEHRRRGVGRALLRAVERKNRIGDVVLMAEEWNTGAQALYESEGFTRTGFARDYYGRGRHGIWMRKQRRPNTDTGARIYV
ncbi:MAG: hypothetical protein AVDCRST_MAG87-2885 [uncultured Thermomicrobiales bacterium]|uniref:N-acetyltransferase domain-containing protein n=1 Tax=uncultured Thermomicrobiales bacterium TaxID=1645740 RepID=A0A6J4VHP8_9BACT|nr:MAG: hypothetical protein AVDCRST_MAG87-2885 [uncultured Thermomicrobiales bacterium]